MNFNETYKKQMDNFCDENITASANDILLKAKSAEAPSESRIIEFKPKKKAKKFTAFIAAAVACSMVASVTALAATGVLGQWINQIFGDKVTSEIVDKGYLYEINQSKEDENFRIDLIAVTGDSSTPKLLFDVYLNGEDMVKATDKILLHAYILPEEIMKNEIDDYAPSMGIGVKDENAEGLYHVLMDGPMAWLTGGDEVMVKVSNVILNPTTEGTGIEDAGDVSDYIGKECDEWIAADLQYSFTPAATNFHPISDIIYDEGISFNHNGISYNLTRGEYGVYASMLSFEYDYLGTEFAKGETEYEKLEAKLHENWRSFIKDVTLIVDGTEYKVNAKETEMGYTYCNPETKHCNAVPYFPAFEYENTQNIVLKYKDTSYTLKDGDNIPGEEIAVPDTLMPEIVVPGESTVPEEIITE
ncbi:MAG: hypothetical protein IJZ51_11165 [Ruminiclostridium sp.]|nr:hypothetical protein [Ruminiclostridium sp.]